MTLGFGLVLLSMTVLAQGFFSGSEMALVSANHDRLRVAADAGDKGAGMALDLLDREDRLLGTCLIGTNLSLICSSTLVPLMLATAGFNEALTIAILTPLVLTLGEALPKTVYGYHADTIAPLAARLLSLFERLFAVPLFVVAAWSRVLETIPSESAAVSREGIVELLDEAEMGGDIDPADRALIRRLFAMSDTPVHTCMTPLVDVVAVPEDAVADEAIAKVLHHGMSRIPVYRDRIDHIVGVVDHRDLLFNKDTAGMTVARMMVPVRYVPEAKRTAQLLRELRMLGTHLAIVVDEYGGAVGLVTVEDLVEEVVGDIRDERDKAVPGVRRLSERDWRVPARTEIEALNQTISHELPEGDYETIAGLVLAILGRIPDAGEVIHIDGFSVLVEAANERSIQTVRLTVPRPAKPI
jgi:CBS domain containing-hemolysin-like protein